ncbi:MAG TPA: hypothetical protein VEF76_00055, partial [Patescibacteria group bacterium]|nr:hypothetical protein [Patescibacteria group bacterium]
LNMVFGLFAMGRNLITAWGLRIDANARDAYGMQKGGHFRGDFDQISALGEWPIESVATFTLVLVALALLTAIGLAIFLPKRERLGRL